MASPYIFHGVKAAKSSAAVKAFREYGFIVVHDFLTDKELTPLSLSAREMAQRRGSRVFPEMDLEYQKMFEFDASLKPKPSVDFKSEPLPESIQQEVDKVDQSQTHQLVTRKMEFKFKDQKRIDRAYNKMMRITKKYARAKGGSQMADDIERINEEAENTPSKDVLDKIRRQNHYPTLKRAYEEYRDSGQMELTVRKDTHTNDAIEFTQNWGKSWCICCVEDAGMEKVVLGDRKDGAAPPPSSVGAIVGEVAAALTGDVVIRLFLDTVLESFPFLNAAPIAAACSGLNYDSNHSLSVAIGLQDARGPGTSHRDGCSTIVFPGSHHLIQQITHHGRELERLQVDGVFDMGRTLRLLPERSSLPPPLHLPPLPPGSALLSHHYLLVGSSPQMLGSAAHYVPPVYRSGQRNPFLYSLTLLPDRSTFDGRDGSWMVKDTHGPLHGMKKGDLIQDEKKFPTLYRALDIE